MHLFGLLTALLFLIYDAGEVFGSEVRSSIVGGGDAPEGRWPWMAYLNISNSRKETWRCGGSLLNHEWVLTSANCIDPSRDVLLKRSMVWLGTTDLMAPSAFYKGIMNFVIHSDYAAHSGGYVNNIALVKLKTKVSSFSPRVAPVHLASVHDTFGPTSECWITGWGNVHTGVPLSGRQTLQELRIQMVPQSDCQAVYPALSENALCAGDPKGGKDACKGDYGGPLVCRTPGGFVQAGVMSFGSAKGCALPGSPGIYSEVASFLDWIEYYIQQM